MTARKKSAGLVLYREREGLEVLLVHPGGPFWAQKDRGAWSIPKGEFDDTEDPLDAARREFQEETGFRPEGAFRPLAPVVQKSGKLVYAWAVEGNMNPDCISSNRFTMEWPPRSGRLAEFPEVDRAAFFPVESALEKINPAQAGFLLELKALLAGRKE